MEDALVFILDLLDRICSLRILLDQSIFSIICSCNQACAAMIVQQRQGKRQISLANQQYVIEDVERDRWWTILLVLLFLLWLGRRLCF